MRFKKQRPAGSGVGRARDELRTAARGVRQMYLDPLQIPSHLYHFSRLCSIQKILKSKVLWASDVRCTGDPTEMRYPVEVLREAVSRTQFLESLGPNLEEHLLEMCIHVACLSLERDLRTQWRDYADCGRGCAIEFAFDGLGRSLDGMSGFPMAYDRDVQTRMFETILRKAEEIARRIRPPVEAFRDEVYRELGALLFLVKNPEHAAEHEWRLQVYHDDLRFAPGERPDGACCRELPVGTPEAVVGLLLGPDCPMSLPEARALLAKNGYSNTAVRQVSWTELR